MATETVSPDRRKVFAAQPKTVAPVNGTKPASNKESELEIETSEIKKGGVPPVSSEVSNKNPLTRVEMIHLGKKEKFLVEQIETAKSEKAKNEYRKRLAEVQTQLYGPPVDDSPPAPRPKPAHVSPAKGATEEELLSAYEYATKYKKEHLITAEMRAAWEKAQRTEAGV